MTAALNWTLTDQDLAEETRPQVREVADQIASDAEAGYGFPGARSTPVTVVDTDEGCRVQAEGSFAHLEEWGGAKSVAKAPMRRAAEASGGTFQEA